MSEPHKDIYDFDKLEDMFEAIDTLTRTTSVLASVDGQLAADLVKLTNTLIELSQTGLQQAASGSPVDREAVGSDVDLDDLTTAVPSQKKESFEQDYDEIIDVLTGQPVNK